MVAGVSFYNHEDDRSCFVRKVDWRTDLLETYEDDLLSLFAISIADYNHPDGLRRYWARCGVGRVFRLADFARPDSPRLGGDAKTIKFNKILR